MDRRAEAQMWHRAGFPNKEIAERMNLSRSGVYYLLNTEAGVRQATHTAESIKTILGYRNAGMTWPQVGGAIGKTGPSAGVNACLLLRRLKKRFPAEYERLAK